MRKPLRALALLFLVLPAMAQTFEVATVKPEPPPAPGQIIGMGMTGGPGSTSPTRVRFSNFTVRDLISSAYDVDGDRLAGPDWFREIRYEVVATLAEGTTSGQFRIMLQGLLAERFKLSLHRESKTMAFYSLTIARGGSKLSPPEADKSVSAQSRNSANSKLTRDKHGYPVLVPGATQIAIMSDHARWHGHNESMSEIARTLGFQTGLPVQDDTGLSGKYDFTISWIPQRPGSVPAENDEAGPSITVL